MDAPLPARSFAWTPDPASGIRARFIEANGLTFELAEMEAADGSTDRLALCLHGFPELNFSWRFQLPLLASRGWRVWAPDLRGYGGSDKPTHRRDYAIPRLLDDVAALIDASGAREVMLVAHDWGAIVAWMFAIRRIRPLSKLVIMNVPHPLCGRREIRTWKQLRKSWYILFFQLPRLPEFGLLRNDAAAIKRAFAGMAIDKARFPPDVTNIYAQAAQRPGAITAMVNYYRALLRDFDFASIGDGKVDVPTLMIWGEADTALDIATTRGTDAYVADLELHTLPDVSHWVQQEAPELVNAILTDWFDRRGG
jgi:epoxide hydrolase 4